MTSEEKTLHDRQTAKNAFAQALAIWVAPEIERRKKAGLLGDGFELSGFQIVMGGSYEDSQIRLNEEIRCQWEATLNPEIELELQGNEILPLDSVESIVGYELTEEDQNSGHISAQRIKNRWYIFFDFRYNGAIISDQLASADQFLASARDAIKRNHDVAAIDNLFDAVELMAKCFLIMSPSRDVLRINSHKCIQTQFNSENRWNVNLSDFVSLINSLEKWRPKTRYALKPAKVESAVLKEFLTTAENMRVVLESIRPSREYHGNPTPELMKFMQKIIPVKNVLL